MTVLIKDADITHILNTNSEFVVFDLETTGFSPIKGDMIIEIGAVKIKNRKIADTYSTFINPQKHIPARITGLTHISDRDVKDAPTYRIVLPKFRAFMGDSVLVAHNASFDMGFINHFFHLLNLECNNIALDTIKLAKIVMPGEGSYKLDSLVNKLNIPFKNHHRAISDVTVTAKMFLKFMDHFIGPKESIHYFDITGISLWEKSGFKRIYVNSKIGNIFYDVINCRWINSTADKDKMDEIIDAVYKHLNIKFDSELSSFKGKYYPNYTNRKGTQ